MLSLTLVKIITVMTSPAPLNNLWGLIIYYIVGGPSVCLKFSVKVAWLLFEFNFYIILCLYCSRVFLQDSMHIGCLKITDWSFNVGIFPPKKRRHRCVLVLAHRNVNIVQMHHIPIISSPHVYLFSVCIAFCLSVTFSPLSFPDRVKPKCFHTSDIQLAWAFTTS